MVPKAGLEPAWISPHAPQTCVSTSSTTSAQTEYYYNIASVFKLAEQPFGPFRPSGISLKKPHNPDNRNYRLTESPLNAINNYTSGAGRHNRESRGGQHAQTGSGPAAVIPIPGVSGISVSVCNAPLFLSEWEGRQRSGEPEDLPENDCDE
jgi:hypothetical protein